MGGGGGGYGPTQICGKLGRVFCLAITRYRSLVVWPIRTVFQKSPSLVTNIYFSIIRLQLKFRFSFWSLNRLFSSHLSGSVPGFDPSGQMSGQRSGPAYVRSGQYSGRSLFSRTMVAKVCLRWPEVAKLLGLANTCFWVWWVWNKRRRFGVLFWKTNVNRQFHTKRIWKIFSKLSSSWNRSGFFEAFLHEVFLTWKKKAFRNKSIRQFFVQIVGLKISIEQTIEPLQGSLVIVMSSSSHTSSYHRLRFFWQIFYLHCSSVQNKTSDLLMKEKIKKNVGKYYYLLHFSAIFHGDSCDSQGKGS